MKIEVISIGNELLEGKPNLNASFIGARLFELGYSLRRFVTVPDIKTKIRTSFLDALKCSELIIITGGLGPTFDDLTVESVAEALEKKTYLNTEVLASIEKIFKREDISESPVIRKQAFIIEGAKVIENKVGTAPGQIIAIKESGKTVVLLPGPPRELQPMFDESVVPLLKVKLRKSVTIRIFGLAEIEVQKRIQKIIVDEKIVDRGLINLSILPHGTIVDIKISASGTDELLIDEAVHNVKKKFTDVIGKYVFGFDSDTLESVVGVLLMKHKLNLAVAESCSAGIISAKIANIPGSSYYFVEGITVYSNDSKIRRLCVLPTILEKYGAVSRETLEAMLDGLKRTTNTNCQLAVTGIAGPSSGVTPRKPVGTVYIGVQTPLSKKIEQHLLSGSRNEIREQTALIALDTLRKELLEYK
jgi:nicotinamide-nucleotide amidase